MDKISSWIDKSLDAVERAAANARAALRKQEVTERQLDIARSALLRIRENTADFPSNKDIATEALQNMEAL